MRDAGVTEIDFAVASHYHSDHVGGFSTLSSRITVKTFVDHGDFIPEFDATMGGVRYLSFPDTATFCGDNTIGDNQTAKEGWVFVKAAGLFQYVYIKRIGQTQKCLYVNLGWNLRGLIGRDLHPSEHYEATFVFSPRISGYDSNTARG